MEHEVVDVCIVGAGLSGIGMAAHLAQRCPDRTFRVLERRSDLGGTWDLFRYPGVRSDSDMHTLGFGFEPWVHEKAIADGAAILEYLNRIVDERDLRRRIRFDATVIAADWDAEAALWRVRSEIAGEPQEIAARFLYLAAGYYDYDEPHDARFEGRDAFRGQIVHPQFWPPKLDYSGKRVVVIGSGATAVTLVPALADGGADVTMLQRTPTWMGAKPSRDRIADALRKVLPGKLAYKLTRAKNIWLSDLLFKRARSQPKKFAAALTERTKAALGNAYDAQAFTPPYDPWEQRLCLVPDADLFTVLRDGKARIVTAATDRFVADGVQLEDGRVLPADIIVTATGLQLAFGGKIALSLGGVPIDWTTHFFYRGCMFDGIPNLAVSFGYLNASWTLRADLTAAYLCDVLNTMRQDDALVATPMLPDPAPAAVDAFADFSSGYLTRSKDLMPMSAAELPWKLNMDYREDRRDFATVPVKDGHLRLSSPATAAMRNQAEAA